MGHTFIIAEAGLSHCGDLDHAKDLAKAALEAGANAVKFQTFFGKFPDLLKYELVEKAWLVLFETCNVLGIEWMSTPFDKRSVDFLADCGMPRWKISSGKNTDTRFLEYIRGKNPRFVYLSTGMCNFFDVRRAYEVFAGMKGVTVMQCTTAYPCPMNEVNLSWLTACGYKSVGLSDHTMGIEVPIAAVALGASVIEKHFCLSRKGKGPDDHMSLEPHEFKEMVRCIGNIEIAMGDDLKEPTKSELRIMDGIRERMK